MSHGSYAEPPQFARGQSASTYGGKRKYKGVLRIGADKGISMIAELKDRINQLFAEAEVARHRHATFYAKVVKNMLGIPQRFAKVNRTGARYAQV